MLTAKRPTAIPARLGSALQHVVDDDDRLLHVVEGVLHARRAPVLGQNRDIDLRHRLEQDAVEKHVEIEDLAVQRLERIVVLLEGGARGGIAGRRRAAGKRDGGKQQAGDAAPDAAGGNGNCHERSEGSADRYEACYGDAGIVDNRAAERNCKSPCRCGCVVRLGDRAMTSLGLRSLLLLLPGLMSSA